MFSLFQIKKFNKWGKFWPGAEFLQIYSFRLTCPAWATWEGGASFWRRQLGLGLLEPSTSSTHCSSIKTFLAIDSLTLPFILSSFRQASTLTIGSFGMALSSSLSLSSLRPSIRQDSNPGLSVFRSGSCSSAGGWQDCAPFGPLLFSTSFSAPRRR